MPVSSKEAEPGSSRLLVFFTGLNLVCKCNLKFKCKPEGLKLRVRRVPYLEGEDQQGKTDRSTKTAPPWDPSSSLQNSCQFSGNLEEKPVLVFLENDRPYLKVIPELVLH